VQAVEYSPGNIKTSHYPTGAAGYNPRAIAAPDSADDMSQAQYMMSLAQNKPEERLRMQQELLLLAKQNFLNTRAVPFIKIIQRLTFLQRILRTSLELAKSSQSGCSQVNAGITVR
jgi:hypothetical protein